MDFVSETKTAGSNDDREGDHYLEYLENVNVNRRNCWKRFARIFGPDAKKMWRMTQALHQKLWLDSFLVYCLLNVMFASGIKEINMQLISKKVPQRSMIPL